MAAARVFVVGVVLLGLVGCASSEDEARSSCERLRQHMVDLRLSDVPQPDRQAHREALAGSLGERFVDGCQQLPGAQVRCALAARDSTSLAACSSQ